MTEHRCRHGFVRSQISCPTCDPGSQALKPDSREVSVRIGMKINGCEITGSRGSDAMTCRCECGETFKKSRAAVRWAVAHDRRVCCRECSGALGNQLKEATAAE